MLREDQRSINNMARPEITGRKPSVTADVADRLPGAPMGEPDDIEATAHEERSPVSKDDATPIRVPSIAAYTIKTFCQTHGLSPSMFFKMKRLGIGPREMIVGKRRLISVEAAADWRRARETATPP